jgi:hypothetical protein
MRGQPGLFDVDLHLTRLSDLGDQLLAFAAAGGFEVFRPEPGGPGAFGPRVTGHLYCGRSGGRGGSRTGKIDVARVHATLAARPCAAKTSSHDSMPTELAPRGTRRLLVAEAVPFRAC